MEDIYKLLIARISISIRPEFGKRQILSKWLLKKTTMEDVPYLVLDKDNEILEIEV